MLQMGDSPTLMLEIDDLQRRSCKFLPIKLSTSQLRWSRLVENLGTESRGVSYQSVANLGILSTSKAIFKLMKLS